jgi:hypothetical protein
MKVNWLLLTSSVDLCEYFLKRTEFYSKVVTMRLNNCIAILSLQFTSLQYIQQSVKAPYFTATNPKQTQFQ